MTNITDILQIALSAGLLGCALVALALFQATHILSACFDLARLALRYVVPVWRPVTLLKLSVLTCILWALSGPLHNGLEEIECRFLQPVYLTTETMPDRQRIALYEAKIARHCDSYELEVIRARTAETAAKINSTPLAIYEAALLECGLNPFRVRDDRVAAGWIQFTRAGLRGLGVSLESVIQACNRRDIVTIMDLTDAYLVRRWEQAGKPDMRNTIDLYLAVFAPAHIGANPDKVVYAGFGNPAYDLNSGLDGWFQDSGKIIRKASECDGRITVWEIFLCLERRKGVLLNH